ncbi:hypothetical protein HZC32_01530 [Candidatus Woesearchaeota archaeon]|nr:hypothetical protein [Candidatus Woesearchaeota archaeon]
MMHKLIFPQEIEVWYILPAIRKHLAAKLVRRGLSQKEVAKMMHITEAAISQYQKEKRAKGEIFDVALKREIEASVKKIIRNKNILHPEVIRLSELAKSKGLVCKLHKDKSKLEKKQLPCCNCRYAK